MGCMAMQDDVTQARAEFDWQSFGVSIHLKSHGGIARFARVDWKRLDPEAILDSEAAPLRLSEEQAMAIYVALAEHFGHTGNDTRALRRDYDAERARVDKLIAHAVGGA